MPQPATAGDAVADLHALLTAAGEAKPYVLVGHSYGGLIVRLYASTIRRTYPVSSSSQLSLYRPARIWSKLRSTSIRSRAGYRARSSRTSPSINGQSGLTTTTAQGPLACCRGEWIRFGIGVAKVVVDFDGLDDARDGFGAERSNGVRLDLVSVVTRSSPCVMCPAS